MLGSLVLLLGCVALLIIGGVVFLFSLLFTRRRRMGYGYPRRRSFFPWFFGGSFMDRGFYEERRHEERRHREGFGGEHHRHGEGFGGGHGGHHHSGGGGFGGGGHGGHGGHHH
jgi:hypothetical protein